MRLLPTALLLALSLTQGCKPSASAPLVQQQAQEAAPLTQEVKAPPVVEKPLQVESEPLIRPRLAQITGSEEATEAYREEGDAVQALLPTQQDKAARALREAQTAAAEPEQSAAPAPEPAAAPEPVASPAPPAQQPSAAEKPAPPAKPQAPRKEKEKEKAAPTAEDKAKAWYLAQPAQNYCVQLLASASEERAKAFVRGQGADLRYFRQPMGGQLLYVVTYGSFQSREQAKAALERLPAALRDGEHWLRRFASIHKAVSPP